MSSRDKQSESSLSLIHAMKLADVTRKHYHGQDAKGAGGIPPGALQGAAAFLATAAALLPIRRIVLRHANQQPGGKPFANFVDIVISVGQALVATQAGLFIGSLYGSQTYLDLLKNEPPTSQSPLTDKICQTMWSNVLPPSFVFPPPSSPSMDPRSQTMTALKSAIQSCQRRKGFQDSTTPYDNLDLQ